MLLAGFLAFLLANSCKAQSFPVVVPAVRSITSINDTAFKLSNSLTIIVDENVADTRDEDGMTLIPPTLQEFAETFAEDLQFVFPNTSVHVSSGTDSSSANIFMTIKPGNFTLASGKKTTEGYLLKVTSKGVTIAGSGSRGAFWATRTFLQGLVLNNEEFPASLVEDGPDWETRGFMLGMFSSYNLELFISLSRRRRSSVVPNQLFKRAVYLRILVQGKRICK